MKRLSFSRVNLLLPMVLGMAVILGMLATGASAAAVACTAPPEALANLEWEADGGPAPDTPFLERDTERTLAHYRGRSVVLNFWATWCAPCVREMPALDRLRALVAGDGIEVLAVSEDFQGMKAVDTFYEKNGIANLPPLLDRRFALAQSLGVKGLPTTVLLDANGNIVGRLTGIAEWDAEEAVGFLRQCLAPAG